MNVLLVDNYDSFTYNLAQYLGELGAQVTVERNDAVTVAAIAERGFRAIVISPGPCTPNEAGISMDVVRELGGKVPILGVCLGHQCIGQVFGGEVVRAPEVMHGKTSIIHHDGRGIFAGLQDPLVATRYHSLVVAPASVPAVLEVSATTDDGTVMGLRHRSLPIEGVQFHPESVLTAEGHRLLANWLSRCGQPKALARVS
jgi:anthranilate synthase/aminodeoxychorismate synthase-like glutamine amidotransferase